MKSTPQREVCGRAPERYSRSGIGRPCRAHVNAPHTDGVLPGLCAAWRLLSHAAPIDSKAVDEVCSRQDTHLHWHSHHVVYGWPTRCCAAVVLY